MNPASVFRPSPEHAPALGSVFTRCRWTGTTRLKATLMKCVAMSSAPLRRVVSSSVSPP